MDVLRLYDILDEFKAFYADYSTIHDGLRWYEDICLETSETIYSTLANKSTEKKYLIGQITDMILSEKLNGKIIKCYIDGKKQTHGFCFIPYDKKVVIIQSLGGLYAANTKVFGKDTFARLLNESLTDYQATLRLYNFHVPGDEYKWWPFVVSELKDLYQVTLPDRKKYKDRLDELRVQRLTELEVTFANYKDKIYQYEIIDGYYWVPSAGMYLSRKPDSYERILGMFYYPK